jgi:6-phosphofructokinase 1
MKRIAILTRDCAGINTAIRAVVRTAYHYGIDVLGVVKGYEGLISGDFIPLDRRSVSGILNLGGSILKTARSKRFKDKEFQKLAVRNIRENSIDGLIVIGGNGSLTGAHILVEDYGIPTIGVPATIDNDINGVDLTIGADTAVNVALDAIDKIRDTALSLERVFVVEVMGRDSGYIALQVALAGGCEEVLLPEREHDIVKMSEEIKAGNAMGKVSWIVIVAEGKARASVIAETITEITGLETRVAVLGHIQRGGRPTALDRILASRLGSYAVDLFKDRKTGLCVHLENDREAAFPLSKAIEPKKVDIEAQYRLIKLLT